MPDTILPSWTDGAARQAILSFVAAATDPTQHGYIAPPQRIAAFDHDGTLWCEKPQYVQMAFILENLKDQIERVPALASNAIVQAALHKHSAVMRSLTLAKFLEAASAAGPGPTPEEYEAAARAWLATARHPRFHVPYTHLVYQPMLELMDYLRASGFTIIICSGGGIEFVRTVADDLYGVGREHVIGTAMGYDLDEKNGRLELDREPSLVGPGNDGAGKPINIQHRMGRQPVFAAGNSMGDAQMLRVAAQSRPSSLCLVISHDDAEREYAYDSAPGTRRPRAGLGGVARQRGWVIASMKNDWKRVFPSLDATRRL